MRFDYIDCKVGKKTSSPHRQHHTYTHLRKGGLCKGLRLIGVGLTSPLISIKKDMFTLTEISPKKGIDSIDSNLTDMT